MIEEKETFWRKKGFYVSLCAAMICVMAIGTVYYKMNAGGTTPDSKQMAEVNESTMVPTSEPAGGSATEQSDAGTEVASIGKNTEIKETKSTEEKNVNEEKTVTKEKTVQKKAEEKVKESGSEKTDTVATMSQTTHNFSEDEGLLWPVEGDVLMRFSMSNTTYFKTLGQYRCNPAIAIAANEGTKVKSAAAGTVLATGAKSDIGNTVTVDIGSGYKLIYGQLENVSVKKGQELKEGDVIGTIAAPTKYYTEEGSNLYFQVLENETAVDPLLLLR